MSRKSGQRDPKAKKLSPCPALLCVWHLSSSGSIRPLCFWKPVKQKTTLSIKTLLFFAGTLHIPLWELGRAARLAAVSRCEHVAAPCLPLVPCPFSTGLASLSSSPLPPAPAVTALTDPSDSVHQEVAVSPFPVPCCAESQTPVLTPGASLATHHPDLGCLSGIPVIPVKCAQWGRAITDLPSPINPAVDSEKILLKSIFFRGKKMLRLVFVRAAGPGLTRTRG